MNGFVDCNKIIDKKKITEIQIIDTYEGFTKLKKAWEKILTKNDEKNFYLSYDWFYALLQLTEKPPHKICLFIYIINKLIVAILPCLHDILKLRLFKYRSIEIIGNIYSPFRGCIILKGYEKEVAIAFSEKLLTTGYNKWEILKFEDVSPNDVFIRYLIEYFKIKNAVIIESESQTNIITHFSYLKNSREFNKKLSKNFRRQINKGINRLKRNGLFKIEVTKNDEQELDRFLEDYYEIYNLSWKEKEEDKKIHFNIAKKLINKNMIRIFILYFKPNKNRNDSRNNNDYINKTGNYRDFIPIATYYAIVNKKNSIRIKNGL